MTRPSDDVLDIVAWTASTLFTRLKHLPWEAEPDCWFYTHPTDPIVGDWAWSIVIHGRDNLTLRVHYDGSWLGVHVTPGSHVWRAATFMYGLFASGHAQVVSIISDAAVLFEYFLTKEDVG